MAPQTRSRAKTKMHVPNGLPSSSMPKAKLRKSSKVSKSIAVSSRGGGGLVALRGSSVPGVMDHAQSESESDRANYALLVVLYTLQGIPMGLSMTIPLLIQQRFATVAKAAATAAAATDLSASATSVLASVDTSSATLYNAQAMFALCSWPFSLKLLWAPLVDAVYSKVRSVHRTKVLHLQSHRLTHSHPARPPACQHHVLVRTATSA